MTTSTFALQTNLFKGVFCFALFFLNYFSSAQSRYNDPSVLRDPTGYKLRVGDVMRVIVRGEPDCTLEAKINNDGKIRLVYLGEIALVGITVKQAEVKITRDYQSNFIFKEPTVSVTVSKYTERSVFLSGALNKKGPYIFPPEVEAMNIVEVIARAGGFNEIARKSKVYVTRTFFDERGNARETKTYEVDVEGLSTGNIRGTSKRFWIYPNDRIEVPERLL
jgi:polysaccharide export outer membrane protein